MTPFITFILIFGFSVPTICLNWEPKFTKVESYFNSKYFENVTCELKAKRGSLGIINVAVDYKQPIDFGWAQFKLYYKFGSEYKKFYLDFEYDYCKAMAGEIPPELRLYIRIGLFIVMKTFPQYIHRCPYKGHYEIKDYDIGKFMQRYSANMPEIVPTGDYKIYMADVDKDHNEILMNGYLYFTIRRKTGSRSSDKFDFMNIKWVRPTIPEFYTINEEKVENYTAIL